MLADHLIKRQELRTQKVGQPQWLSLLKTVSWRALGTLDTLVISYLVTGEISLALTIGGVELISKMILYYLHERAWNRININWNERSVRKYQNRS